MSRYLILLVILGKLSAVGAWALGATPALPLILFFAPDFVVAWHLFVPGAQGMVRVFTRFETDRREVWLTIDDGPDEDDTPRLLDLLDKHKGRATFFLIGERAARMPHLVRAIAARGHEVAPHTQTHPLRTFWCASPSRVARELDQPLEVLAACGIRPLRFRSPVGIKNPFLARALFQRGLVYIGWTIRSWDSVRSDPRKVVDHVAPRVRPGAILLLHEGPRLHPEVRVQAIEGVLEALTAKGYTCVLPRQDQLR